MNANQHIDRADLALFAMQLLHPEEEQAVALHVSHCESCRRELAAVQGDLAVLALTAEMHSPPALARERLLDEVWRDRESWEPAAAATTEPQRWEEQAERTADGTSPLERGRQSDPEGAAGGLAGRVVARGLPWVGWAIAAGLAVTAGNLVHERDALRGTVATQSDVVRRMQTEASTARQVLSTLTDRSAMRVTLRRPKEAAVPLGRATYRPETGSLVFAASGMAQLGPYKTYELWLIPADGRDPMPAGTFVPDAKGNASVLLPSLPKGVVAKAFGITVEDEGGSPTPTMPIVMAGT